MLCWSFYRGGGYGIAYVLIGGSSKCRHIADRGGEGVEKAQKLRTYLKNVPFAIGIVQLHAYHVVRGFSGAL